MAPAAEETGQKGAAFFGEDGREKFDAVVERGVVEDGERGAAGTAFRVGCGVKQPTYARVQNGAGAHRAGLKCGVKGAVFQTIVFESAGRGAKCDYFGMGGRVGRGDNLVATARDDFIVENDDRANGNFAGLLGGLRFGDGFAKEKLVMG